VRRGLLIAIVAAAALATAGTSLPATCTAEVQAARIAAADAYAKKIPAERRAYFKTHKQAAQRKAFVAKQRKKLARLRAAAACTVPPPPPPAPAPTPPSTLTIYPDVPSDRADAARTGYQIALSYLPKIGAPGTWHADVLVAGAVSEIVAAVAKTGSSTDFILQVMADGGGGFAGPGRVYVVPAGRSYDSTRYERRVMGVVHEMWHTVQYALAGGRQDPSPMWLHEGSAEFVGYSAVQDAGIAASSVHRDSVWAVQHDFASIPLESSSGSAAYNEGFVAVERLVALKGLDSLVAYWTEVGRGTAWDAAFQKVFGESVQQFDAEFAAYRKTVS
jgi:hypothetical protein